MSDNATKYEVLSERYLRSILDISVIYLNLHNPCPFIRLMPENSNPFGQSVMGAPNQSIFPTSNGLLTYIFPWSVGLFIQSTRLFFGQLDFFMVN